jgi:hypothetical protein
MNVFEWYEAEKTDLGFSLSVQEGLVASYVGICHQSQCPNNDFEGGSYYPNETRTQKMSELCPLIWL